MAKMFFQIISLTIIHRLSSSDGANLPALQTPCTNGVCVESYLCENKTVLVYGEGLIDIRMGGDDEPRYCAIGEECCMLNDYDSEEELIGLSHHAKALQPIHRCGVRNYRPTKSNEFSKNSISKFGEFPWMMAILQSKVEPHQASPYFRSMQNVYSSKKPQPRFDYRGGGSLIHPSVVLTAAHCVDAIPHERLFVRAGEWDTRSNDEPSPHQNRQVQRIIIHPNYNSRTISNDIALLILAEPVRLANHINTICLPPPQHRFPPTGRCFVSGWGKDNYGGRFQAILKRVSVPLVDRATCQRALRRTGLGRFFRLHHSFLCAGGEQGDSCRGDGGSPLVCPAEKRVENENLWPVEQENEDIDATGNDEEDEDDSFVAAQHIRSSFVNDDDAVVEPPFYQAGIVSWGIGCNEQVPAAYVNVASFRTWVDGVMTRNGWDERYYTAVA